MFIKLQPDQVPLFWDNIKLDLLSSHEVSNEFQFDFTNDLLVKALSGNMQVWLGYEQDNIIKILYLTMIMQDKITEEKSLYIHTCCIKDEISFNVFKDIYTAMSEYAISNECKSIVFETSNSDIYDMAKRFEFKQKSIKFIKEL